MINGSGTQPLEYREWLALPAGRDFSGRCLSDAISHGRSGLGCSQQLGDRFDSLLGLEQCRRGSTLLRCQNWRGSIAHSLLSKLTLQQPCHMYTAVMEFDP